MSIKQLVKNALTRLNVHDYEKRLKMRAASYGQWCEREEADVLPLPRTGTDYVLFVSDKGELTPRAYSYIERFLAEHSGVQILYGDEDVCEGAERSMPWYKPDWSPDLLDYAFYFGSVVAVRKELLMTDEEGAKYTEDLYVADPFDPAYRALIRRLCHRCGGYEKGAESIGHVDGILFSSKEGAVMKRFMEEPDCVAGEVGKPSFSVIIPSKNHGRLLSFCLESLEKACEGVRFDVVIVDNGSDEENRNEIARFCSTYEHPVRYLYEPMDFNFSKMCNRGALAAGSDVLVFLNDDVEVVKETRLEYLAGMAAREYTGEVGVKLFYPGGDLIQHAGVTALPMGPVHKLQFTHDTDEHYFGANRGTSNVLAATAALIVVEKKKFYEAGGFPEELKVAFNDVALGYALRDRGYFNVCNKEVYAYHHESLSRGNDGDSADKIGRLLGELQVLRDLYPQYAACDPYYSYHLNTDSTDRRIRPGYLAAEHKPAAMILPPAEKDLTGYRKDPCLMVAVEEFRDGLLKGFIVVLGDDNACYNKELLLEKDGRTYALPITEQYRPDIAENLPDQRNVALCGFAYDIPEDPSFLVGATVGAAAVNKVTGLKLYEMTERTMYV